MANALTSEELLQAAQQRGLLPPDAQLHEESERPWPVVLLTALGAWLAAVPLFAVIGMLLADAVMRNAGTYVVAVLLLAGSVIILRDHKLPVFVEQLAVPALGVGIGVLSYGLFRDLPGRLACVLLAVAVLGLAWAIPRAWLRVLLGAGSSGLAVAASLPRLFTSGGPPLVGWWFALHVMLLPWLGNVYALQRGRVPGSSAATADAFAAGWVLQLLAGFAWWAGMTFLVGGTLGTGVAGELVQALGERRGVQGWLLGSGSALAAGAAAVVLARAWPSLRSLRAGLAALVLVALSVMLPTLGATLLVLAVAVTTRRWRIATAAAVAAAWIVGAFYYQLQWPLATKALVLFGAGVALGLLALAGGSVARPGTAPAAGPWDWRRAAVLVSAVLVLGAANHAIWQKETLIAEGQRVLVRLAPVDPRSLMQGDFMRLRFDVPDPPASTQLPGARRPWLVLKREADGTAKALRVVQGEAPLAPGELRMELVARNGTWTLVTDAWYFQEGDAARWEAARYGEFRVDASGRALLVGLADEKLRAIRP